MGNCYLDLWLWGANLDRVEEGCAVVALADFFFVDRSAYCVGDDFHVTAAALVAVEWDDASGAFFSEDSVIHG